MVQIWKIAIPLCAFGIGAWDILTPPLSRATDILGGVLFGIGLYSLFLSIVMERGLK